MKKYSKEWWKEWFIKSSIRALYTFAEGLIGMTAADGFQLLELDWIKILFTCLIMALLSYAKNFVVGLPELEEK
jgi:hypothetical protein